GDSSVRRKSGFRFTRATAMIPTLFSGSTIPVLEQVASFTESRHSILAGNLANLDTPGYKVRDLSEKGFQARLRAALSARDSAAQAAAFGASPGLMPPAGPGAATAFYNPSGSAAPGTSLAAVNKNLTDLLHH